MPLRKNKIELKTKKCKIAISLIALCIFFEGFNMNPECTVLN